jgi:hypothetical protein
MPGVGAVRAFNNANFDRFELNQLDTDIESNVGDYTVDEDVTAGYLMGTWRGNAWTVIGGVRVEDTDNDVRANRTEIFEEGEEIDGVILEDDTVVITPTADSNSYTNWLPSRTSRTRTGQTVGASCNTRSTPGRDASESSLPSDRSAGRHPVAGFATGSPRGTGTACIATCNCADTLMSVKIKQRYCQDWRSLPA